MGAAQEVRVPRGTVAAGLAGISVEIRSGAKRVRVPLESVSAKLIEATVPVNTPVGPAQLVVCHGEDESLPAAVRVAATAFGAYALNNLGWGPGQILNGAPELKLDPNTLLNATRPGRIRRGVLEIKATPNTLTDAARPGQAMTLLGTGMGSDHFGGIPVLVGGKKASASSRRLNDGVDQVTFTLPCDTPEGCYVPVEVRAAPGIASNVLTISVNRKGGACSAAGN